jgi:hypothetical protein
MKRTAVFTVLFALSAWAADDPPQPQVPVSHFQWELAKWDFRKPGPWIIDMTGHQHSARYALTGYSIDFFGIVFDGTTLARLPDAADLAPTGPFTIKVDIGRTDEQKKQPAGKQAEHLLTRGDRERFSYDLSLVGDKIRFTLMDEKGKTSAIQAPAPLDGVVNSFYAVFDPSTGEQSLFKLGDCEPRAKTITKLRPAQTVPSSEVRLYDGFRGASSRSRSRRAFKPRRKSRARRPAA